MNFEEWWEDKECNDSTEKERFYAEWAWSHQQKEIDRLREVVRGAIVDATEIDELPTKVK